MTQDRFPLNGETIKFDKDGKLLDGQHRLAAIVMSGVTKLIYVAYNVPRSAIITIDTGRNRSFSDQLRVAYEYHHSAQLSSLIRLIFEWNETGWISHKTFRQIEPDEANDYIKSNPDVADLPQRINDFNGSMIHRIMARNHFGFLLWLFSRVSPEDAKIYLSCLVDCIEHYPGDPALVLRKQLLLMRSDRYRRVKRNIVIGLVIQNWGKWRAHQEVKLVRVPPATQPWDAGTYPKPH